MLVQDQDCFDMAEVVFDIVRQNGGMRGHIARSANADTTIVQLAVFPLSIHKRGYRRTDGKPAAQNRLPSAPTTHTSEIIDG